MIFHSPKFRKNDSVLRSAFQNHRIFFQLKITYYLLLAFIRNTLQHNDATSKRIGNQINRCVKSIYKTAKSHRVEHNFLWMLDDIDYPRKVHFVVRAIIHVCAGRTLNLQRKINSVNWEGAVRVVFFLISTLRPIRRPLPSSSHFSLPSPLPLLPFFLYLSLSHPSSLEYTPGMQRIGRGWTCLSTFWNAACPFLGNLPLPPAIPFYCYNPRPIIGSTFTPQQLITP